MIDVIIVDDEPLIRDGLVKLFSWKDYQMQVSAVFPNGSLALEYLEKHAADIIITDIKMPVMNGIELMQECQRRNLPAKFIVLSGYSDFEYVKTAARLGIENYLLKPVDTQEMSQTLIQVKRKIEAQRQNKICLLYTSSCSGHTRNIRGLVQILKQCHLQGFQIHIIYQQQIIRP